MRFFLKADILQLSNDRDIMYSIKVDITYMYAIVKYQQKNFGGNLIEVFRIRKNRLPCFTSRFRCDEIPDG